LGADLALCILPPTIPAETNAAIFGLPMNGDSILIASRKLSITPVLSTRKVILIKAKLMLMSTPTIAYPAYSFKFDSTIF
jgi:hypothetical protein